MANKTKYILQVMVDIDPELEAEWNDWYNNKHIPDILGCPGWYSAERYVRVAGNDGPKYTTIYEVEDEHIFESELFKQRRGGAQFKDHVNHVSNIFYKVIYSESNK